MVAAFYLKQAHFQQAGCEIILININKGPAHKRIEISLRAGPFLGRSTLLQQGLSSLLLRNLHGALCAAACDDRAELRAGHGVIHQEIVGIISCNWHVVPLKSPLIGFHIVPRKVRFRVVPPEKRLVVPALGDT